MRCAIGLVTVLLLTISASFAVETRYLQGLGDTRYQPVDSDVIGRRFHVYVMLPDGYDETPAKHFASNPALHRNLPFFLQPPARASASDERPRLFVGSGALDDPEYRVPARNWIAHFSGRDDLAWDLKTEILEGHSHMSAPPASFRQGMAWLFSTDWQ